MTSGEPLVHAHIQIGYATATNETSWTPRADPVLSWGSPGLWDDDKVFYPRVLYNGHVYEMWYDGERSDGKTQIGYATSPDGLNWTRESSNPVLRRGTGWDANDLYGLDVLLTGGLYHMWYGGNASFLNWRLGYAVSPKGMRTSISPGPFVHSDSTVRITVQVNNPTGLSFFAELQSPDGVPVDSLELYDDGAHGDSLAGDGIFSSSWVARLGPKTVYVDLGLRLGNGLRFEKVNNIYTIVVTSADAKSEFPNVYSLEQNYPNPFNPSTVIQFSLPRSGPVTLKVFNILGEEVATLASGSFSVGTHQVEWDAQGLGSGTYFYRLQAGGFTETKKLILLH